ncbi:hypothetical protein MXD61_06450 [Frankia sp. AgPm24]|uniref:hypothetical protein n=1 Tax=Frankia sp. AgPm24 TaxID=631128 RepID=UPI00200F1FA4|nr:hypothetical protein [Frankia sp. AgPm24]MCK9921533.1 hypothetical protein [Frankia sp. AgPm24]
MERVDANHLPIIEIVDDEPPAWFVDAARRGLADYAAGRYVTCDAETFDRLLTDAAHPEVS